MNSKGPRTEPWGTPHEVGNAAEKQFAIFMVWCLPVRYDKNHNIMYHIWRVYKHTRNDEDSTNYKEALNAATTEIRKF